MSRGGSRSDTHGHLVLDASDVEQRLDLLPQLPPRPGAELEVFPQVSLDNHEGQTLLLEFLVVLTGQVTSDVGLHPGHDLAKTFVTKFFHLTQDSGAEEYLFSRKEEVEHWEKSARRKTDLRDAARSSNVIIKLMINS